MRICTFGGIYSMNMLYGLLSGRYSSRANNAELTMNLFLSSCFPPLLSQLEKIWQGLQELGYSPNAYSYTTLFNVSGKLGVARAFHPMYYREMKVKKTP